MHFQKILLAILSVLSCIFIFLPWAETPELGIIKGINNGTGIFSLFCSGAVFALSLVAGNRERSIPSGAKLATVILGIGIGICTIIFYTLIEDMALKMVNAGKISFFGTPIGSVWDNKDFFFKPGLYLTGITSLLMVIIAIAFNSNISEISQIGEEQKAEINKAEIFGKTDLINQLDKITSLHEKGILDNEIFEDEKNKILNKLRPQKNEIVLPTVVEEQIEAVGPVNHPTVSRKGEFLYVVLFSLLGLALLGLMYFFSQKSDRSNFFVGKTFKSYILDEDGKIGGDSTYVQSYDIFTSDTTLINIITSDGEVVLRTNSKYKIQDSKLLIHDSVNIFDIVLLKEDSILLKSNDNRNTMLVQTDRSIDDFNIDIKSRMTVEEFEFDSIHKLHPIELSTETTNYGLKNQKGNKLVFVATDKAYMRINNKFETINFNENFKSATSNLALEYENDKYIVQIIGNSIDDKNAVIEGATLDEGIIKVFNKNTKEILEIEFSGTSGE